MKNIDDILDYVYEKKLSNLEIKNLILEIDKPKPRQVYERKYKTKFHKFIDEYQIFITVVSGIICINILIHLLFKI